MFSNKCSGVKVQYFPLRCSAVEVKVLKFGNTQVKYKFKLSLYTVLEKIHVFNAVNLHHWNWKAWLPGL